MCLGMVLVNEGPEIGLCSRECAIEGGVDGVVVNERFVEDVLFTRVRTKSGGSHHFLVIYFFWLCPISRYNASNPLLSKSKNRTFCSFTLNFTVPKSKIKPFCTFNQVRRGLLRIHIISLIPFFIPKNVYPSPFPIKLNSCQSIFK